MALNIKSNEADRLARALADATGETITEAVTNALRERLARERASRLRRPRRSAQLAEIAREFQALPVLDPRPADEIVGYDEHGLPA